MNKTGERHFIEEKFKNEAAYYGHLTHIISYKFALDFAKNKNVLDFGCGTGYGSKILSEKALSVTGTDISNETINYAKKKYKSENLNFINIEELNKKKYHQKFDLITSFQVIEHVENEFKYIEKILQLLEPTGYFILTTPNKTNRLYQYIQQPWNKFHLKEYNESELANLLKKYFEDINMLKISGKQEFVKHELSRLNIQKKISLPFTFSFLPKSLSIKLLEFQKSIFIFLKLIKNLFAKAKTSRMKIAEFNSNFTIDDMIIEKNPAVFTDLLCICKKSKYHSQNL
jgi:2-polyprenyl-3-methyl-5-hydroxy-6-metoxy-1,4-benzoquinol methylase